MDKIEAILDNKPQPPVSALIESQSLFNISFKVNHGRPSLDPLGREGLYVWIEVWRKVSVRGLWTLSNTWTHTLLYLLILGLKWGLIPKKYIGDKAVGALREREREREKSSFPIYGQGRSVKRSLMNFSTDFFWYVNAPTEIKKLSGQLPTRFHPREQRMIVKTYYCLAAAVYFLAHVQCSLSASMEQVRLIWMSMVSPDLFGVE